MTNTIPTDQPRAVALKVDPKIIANLSDTRKQWYCPLATALTDWLMIAGAAMLCHQFETSTFFYFIYPLAFLFIGGRMHGLAILGHDAVHYRFFPNRHWNDILADLLICWPFMITTRFYRIERHFGHHRNIGTSDDPHILQSYSKRLSMWQFPMPWYRLVGALLLQGTLGVLQSVPRMIVTNLREISIPAAIVRVLYYAAIVKLISDTGTWKEALLYYYLPFSFQGSLLMHFRLIAEHFGIVRSDFNGNFTRTTRASSATRRFLDSTFLVPHQCGYHIEHHDYPSVPFYRLPELHRIYREAQRSNPSLLNLYHLSDGYWGVWRELTTRGNLKQARD